jgi:hypothetical protein
LTKATDVIQGTLDLLILKALALNPMHGWGISDHVSRMSGGIFKIGQGSMYPALHRFENRGWIRNWRQTPNNRIARLYELTPAENTRSRMRSRSGVPTRAPWTGNTGAVEDLRLSVEGYLEKFVLMVIFFGFLMTPAGSVLSSPDS